MDRDGRCTAQAGQLFVPIRHLYRGTVAPGAYLEVLGPDGPSVAALDRERLAIGKSAENDVALSWDGTVSQLHAVIERFAAGWCVRDVGSRNGTYLNGERIVGERVLRAGDEIRVGATRLVFSTGRGSVAPTRTDAVQAAPELTRREREVLIALCRPVLQRNLLTEPATIRGIASELVVSESAVKKHLGRLYDKFAIYGEERRRGRLVAEAVRRGAVSLGDV
jgi:pSer/pThr/pTyr-binding forkhead associated (FHA) protein